MEMRRRDLLQGAAAGAAACSLASSSFLKSAFAADDIVVARIYDQTGDLSIYGKPMVECFDLAIEEINARGGLLGRRLRTVDYDPRSNLRLYELYAERVVLEDRAVVVHAGITSASREVIRPIFRKNDTLYFYSTFYEGGVCDRNFFATGTTPAQTVEKLVPYCIKRFGPRIYTLAADYNYGRITADWVTKFARENNGEVVVTEFFPLGAFDFVDAIRNIQKTKPDLVMSVLIGDAQMSFYRQWASAGMKREIPIASTTFGAGQENAILNADVSDGIIISWGYFEDLQTPSSKAFLQRYRAKYGIQHAYMLEPPVATYEGVLLWAKAVERAGSLDRLKVIEALEDGISIDGPTGKVLIDPKTHHCSRSTFIAESRERGFQVLETFENQFPADTSAVCDLEANPDDNTHYKIKI